MTPSLTNVTVSFVPDGTLVNGTQHSQMFQALNAQAPSTAAWEQDVLNDLHSIPALAGVSFTVGKDDGEALNSSGAVQNDPRFGAIRIAATPGLFGNEEIMISSRLLFAGPALIDPSQALPGQPPPPPPPGGYLSSLIDLGTYQWGKLFLPLGAPVGWIK
jgi:hypothetical protein